MDLQDRADRLAGLMEERLDVRGEGLAVKYRRAARRMPRWVGREIEALIEALDLARNPKLLQRIDMARIEAGTDKAEAWLKTIDPWDRRKGIVLHWLAGNALNILLVVAVSLAIMGWRGLL